MFKLQDYVSTYYGRAKAFEFHGVMLYFSYETLIAFTNKHGWTYVTTKKWSNTTRRHLGHVPYAGRRYVPQERLEDLALLALRDACLELHPLIKKEKVR